MKDYQEALDVLADRELDSIGKMAVKDLQELIDNHSKLEKALDKACYKLACLMYSYEDEEDPECSGVNTAYTCHRSDAKWIKEKYIKEVTK